jgi:hypothetical protein
MDLGRRGLFGFYAGIVVLVVNNAHPFGVSGGEECLILPKRLWRLRLLW